MLSKKEQSIAAISMYAARGNQDSLKVILARGLDCGLTVSEEKEVLTQLYAYCGFPRSMGALVTLMNLTKERAAQGIKDEAGRGPSPVKSSDMFVVGGQNQLKLFGRPALGEVLTFAPALDQFLKAHLFGDIFSRDNLDWRTRELSTVAALSVLDGVKNELNTHIAHAKHNGVTQAQIDEVLIMAARCRNGMVLSESDENRQRLFKQIRQLLSVRSFIKTGMISCFAPKCTSRRTSMKRNTMQPSSSDTRSGL